MKTPLILLALAASAAMAQSSPPPPAPSTDAAPPPSLNLRLDAATMRQLNSGTQPARDAKKDDKDKLLPALGTGAMKGIDAPREMRSGAARPFPKDMLPGLP